MMRQTCSSALILTKGVPQPGVVGRVESQPAECDQGKEQVAAVGIPQVVDKALAHILAVAVK